MHAAVHALAALGFLRISHGVGMFVARPRSHAAILDHAWQNATPMELALMRAAIDERMPVVVAMQVDSQPAVRLPRTLSDISFLAHERSVCRSGYADVFIQADLAFHRTVAASVRGTEVTVGLHQHIGRRMLPALLPVADVLASDEDLDAAHLQLVGAILAGEPMTTARLARFIARRELGSLGRALG